MDTDFWHKRWKTKDIGFHESQANPLLVKYFSELSLKEGSRLFVPLCGKTLAINWFLERGHKVAGIELNPIAVNELFSDLNHEPIIEDLGALKRYSAANIDIFVGDIFDLSQQILGNISAVYDRAALVALPDTMRPDYCTHIRAITNKAPQLLITYDYDQELMKGPPFSISNENINQYYAAHYEITHLACEEVDGGIKGICPGDENVWLLK